MKKLIPAFKDTLFAPTYEIVSEYAEIGIDCLLESDALKSIPVVGTLSSICKAGYNIHERNLIKQTVNFIHSFNSGTLSQDNIDKHRNELENNPDKAEKELGRILIILGNHIENIQSQVLGSFYSAYVQRLIPWNKFCELSEANRRMFVNDYYILQEAAHNGGINVNDQELYQVDRLISLGLLQNQNRLGGAIMLSLDEETEKTFDIIITSFGKTFCQHFPSMIIEF